VTNLIKILLVVLAVDWFLPIEAQAGNNRLSFTANGSVSKVYNRRKPANSFKQFKPRIRLAQSNGRKIPPSAALRAAKRAAPGSQGLGVRYLPRRRGYVVTLKTRGKIRRVFVDGRTGRVGR